MFWPALVALSAAAAPSTAPSEPSADAVVVLISRRTAVTPAVSKPLVNDVAQALKTAGVAQALTPEAALSQLARVSVKDTASCNGKRACLAELGRQLKVAWVVTVSLAGVDQEISLGLELLRVSDETVVETDSLLLPKKSKLDPATLEGFAAKVTARISPPTVAPKADEPKADAPVKDPVATTTPAPKDTEPLVPPPPPPAERSHVPSVVLLASGGAAVVAGVVLLVVAGTSRAPLTAGTPGPDGRTLSALTASEAATLNASTTPLLAGGLGALAAGVGLGTAGVLTW
ncbi:MAG: hypothetical protein U0228_10725 [Myxococcaceae bacterium]